VNGAGAVWDYTDGFAYRKDGTGANDPAYSSSSFVPAYWHFMPNALGGGDAFETHADAAAANGTGFPFMSYKSLTPSVAPTPAPTPPPPPRSSSSSSSDSPLAASSGLVLIVAMVCGAAALIAAAVLFSKCYRRKRRGDDIDDDYDYYKRGTLFSRWDDNDVEDGAVSPPQAKPRGTFFKSAYDIPFAKLNLEARPFAKVKQILIL
jgi:hypothetical protein